jgi:hypothetical protein
MGHTEMCLAVAGLSEHEVKDTTQRLSDDWSSFSEADQATLHFSRKQAQNPATLTEADVRELERHHGHDRAWQLIWWASRCHYMTTVADAFQFPLETENPFWNMPGARSQ